MRPQDPAGLLIPIHSARMAYSGGMFLYLARRSFRIFLSVTVCGFLGHQYNTIDDCHTGIFTHVNPRLSRFRVDVLHQCKAFSRRKLPPRVLVCLGTMLLSDLCLSIPGVTSHVCSLVDIGHTSIHGSKCEPSFPYIRSSGYLTQAYLRSCNHVVRRQSPRH